METMNTDRWQATRAYLAEVFGQEEPDAAAVREKTQGAGLPPIAVTADIGRFLTMLARMVGARTVLEVGTLGGYSALHLVRGMPEEGRLLTIELEPHNARVARDNLAAAGVGDRVRVEVGPALEVLPRLAQELGPNSVDLVFLDAEKTEYCDYWRLVRPLLRQGGLLVADNVLGTDSWWIDHMDHPARVGVDRFNRTVAADPDFETTCLLARQGLLLAYRLM